MFTNFTVHENSSSAEATGTERLVGSMGMEIDDDDDDDDDEVWANKTSKVYVCVCIFAHTVTHIKYLI